MNAHRSGVLICSLVALCHTPMILAGSHAHPSAPAPGFARPAAHFSGGTDRRWNPASVSRNSPGVYRINAPRNGQPVRWSGNINRNAHPRWVGNGSLRWNANRNGFRRGRHCGNRIIFIGSFGYPWYLPYSYYDSYYPYGVYPAAYTDETDSSYGPPVYEGAPGDDTEQASGNAGASSQDSPVREVQRRLARDGFYQGSLDGALGSRTYYAIRAYQRSHHLRVDGKVSSQLLEAMGLR